MEKGVKKNTRLYQSLPIPEKPWEDFILVVVERFSNMAHFIPAGRLVMFMWKSCFSEKW